MIKNYEEAKVYLLNILSTICNPSATQGPIPKANNKVPIPTVPPKYHPTETTLISINALTDAIGKFVTFCNPIIRPSLAPGPKFATKYIPPPKPTVRTATIAKLI